MAKQEDILANWFFIAALCDKAAVEADRQADDAMKTRFPALENALRGAAGNYREAAQHVRGYIKKLMEES